MVCCLRMHTQLDKMADESYTEFESSDKNGEMDWYQCINALKKYFSIMKSKKFRFDDIPSDVISERSANHSWQPSCHSSYVNKSCSWCAVVCNTDPQSLTTAHKFHETCHSIISYFMKEESKRCCETTRQESIRTKDESKRGSAFAFIFGVN